MAEIQLSVTVVRNLPTSPYIARRRYGLGYLIFKIRELQRELAKLEKYSLYLIGFSKNLASHFDRSPFHLRLAVLPGWLIQGCSSVSNPFTGEKIHRIFPFVRFTHSYGYGSRAITQTVLLAFP